MDHLTLIPTFAAGLTAALVLGYLSHRIGLSPIVGYLLAGLAVGPFTPGYVADHAIAEEMAEIGVILLMFGVGLHFDVRELLAVRRIALPGAIAQCLISAAAAAAGFAALFGWNWPASLVFGLSVCVASTVVITRVLGDNNQLHTTVGHIAIGWLIVQDILAVLILVLLPALFGGGPLNPAGLPLVLGVAALKIGVLVAGVLVVGGRVVPWVLKRAAGSGSRELFTLTVLVVAVGIAVGSAALFGVSMALGAFLAGMVVGRSEFSVRAATEALPMKDAFAVLFFVSVGMLFDPFALPRTGWLVAATLSVVVLVTPFVAGLVAWLLRYPVRVAFQLALALTQVGEFSFIITKLGSKLKLTDGDVQVPLLPEEATQVVVAVALVTISVNPLLYKLAGPLEKWASRRPRLWRLLTARTRQPVEGAPGAPAVDPAHRAVVVGYGPVGHTVSRLLKENGIEPTVIELNIDTVQKLRAEGTAAVYGDAAHADTLVQAGVGSAGSFILTSSGMQGSEEAIKLVKQINPGIRVLARTAYVKELVGLKGVGAEVVFSGEGEVALALTEAILRRLGATPDQVDRERERVRSEVSGEPSVGPRHAPAGGSPDRVGETH
jgi:CPA2 family monovalent cation:H+ antiporter-2